MIRPFLRRLGLGGLAYRLYHAPVGRVQRSIAAGGPIEEWRTARGRTEMQRAARRLPVPAPAAAPPLEVHLLTGDGFWDQSAFCLWTLACHASRTLVPIIHDDGTLRSEQRDVLLRLFPLAKVISAHEAQTRIEAALPRGKFPVLHERRANYPNIRKLIDVHAGGTGWKLAIDSDLLFFRRPDFLIEWLDDPRQPLHAVDVATCYGYSAAILRELAGQEVAERVNVGLCGLRSEELDWQRIERFCRLLIEREGTHYFLEQALVALLVAGRECAIAPAADYVTLPQLPEVEVCRAVMHHYVAESKRWYFRQNWRRATSAAVDHAG